MILFQPKHVPLILDGRKRQTRRLGKKRCNVGSIHQARTKLFGEPFARLRICAVEQQRLGDITVEEARAEGYDSIYDFRQAFWKINGYPKNMDDLEVWVIKFKLEAPE